MKTRALLLIVPLALLVLMLQSYLWVPSYQRQTVANPARALKLVEASIGDAKMLNPILNADTSSSRITSLVFDGLLGLDEELKLRPRLATRWQVTEKVFLLVDATSRLADGQPASADGILQLLDAQMRTDPALKALIESTRTLPAEVIAQTLQSDGSENVSIQLKRPARIELSLSRVEPGIDQLLAPVLGSTYGDTFSPAQYVVAADVAVDSLDQAALQASLPLIRHQPVVEFELRDGVRFHDGHEFDAGDVEFTYKAIMDDANLSPRKSDFEPIERLEIDGPKRVTIYYKRLFSPALSAWTIGILPEHILTAEAATLGKGMREFAFNRTPVGTGAYSFDTWQSDELIHLRRNEQYWDGAPLYESYYYRVIPDTLTQEVEFRAGAIDVYSPQPHQAARYAVDEQYQAFSSLANGYSYIGYNTRKPLFADPKVRKALSMAINVDDIISYVLYGQGERTTGPYAKNTVWYDDSVQPVPFDPAGAVAILEELGWRKNADGWLEKDGKLFEFNLISNNGNLIRKSIMSIAQNAWRDIGIKCNTQLFEWAVFLKDFINTGSFDATVLGWSMGIDPDLYQVWHSSESGPNQLNFVGFNDANADALIERIRLEYDPDKQRDLAHQLHGIIAEQQPYTFLYAGRSTRVLDRKIVMRTASGGHEPVRSSDGGDLFFHMNRWFKLEHAVEF